MTNLGLPIPNIAFHGPSASKALVAWGNSDGVTFENVDEVLSTPNTTLRIFGKKEVRGHRRVGVLLARAESVEKAKETVFAMSKKIQIKL